MLCVVSRESQSGSAEPVVQIFTTSVLLSERSKKNPPGVEKSANCTYWGGQVEMLSVVEEPGQCQIKPTGALLKAQKVVFCGVGIGHMVLSVLEGYISSRSAA